MCISLQIFARYLAAVPDGFLHWRRLHILLHERTLFSERTHPVVWPSLDRGSSERLLGTWEPPEQSQDFASSSKQDNPRLSWMSLRLRVHIKSLRGTVYAWLFSDSVIRAPSFNVKVLHSCLISQEHGALCRAMHLPCPAAEPLTLESYTTRKRYYPLNTHRGMIAVASCLLAV